MSHIVKRGGAMSSSVTFGSADTPGLTAEANKSAGSSKPKPAAAQAAAPAASSSPVVKRGGAMASSAPMSMGHVEKAAPAAAATSAAAVDTPAATSPTAAEGGGYNNVPTSDEVRGGVVSGKVNAKFSKKKDERDIRFGSTDPSLFGSTFEATGKSAPKRGGAAATNPTPSGGKK